MEMHGVEPVRGPGIISQSDVTGTAVRNDDLWHTIDSNSEWITADLVVDEVRLKV